MDSMTPDGAPSMDARPPSPIINAQAIITDLVTKRHTLWDEVIPLLPTGTDDDPTTTLRLALLAGFARWHGLTDIADAIDSRYVLDDVNDFIASMT